MSPCSRHGREAGRAGRIAWAAVLSASPTWAGPDDVSWVLYRADLTAVSGVEVRLTESAVMYRDARGQRRTLPREQLAAIVRVDSAATFLEQGRASPLPAVPEAEEAGPAAEASTGGPVMAGLLGLTDGQVFRGRLSAESPSVAESVLWDTPLFGTLILPLDRLLFLRLEEGVKEPGASAADVLSLSNGDRLEGVVTRLGPVIRVEPLSGSAVELSAGQVSSIRFANPASETNRARAWLGDGTATDLDALVSESNGDRLVVRIPSGQVAEVPLGELLGARLVADRILPLAALEGRGEVPAERSWTPPLRVGDRAGTPLGLAELELPGPMRVTWRLPRGASRLSLTAELPLDARLWGDATLTFAVDRTTLATVRLCGSEPTHALTLELPGPERADRVLTATLEEGLYGPVQDRAIFRRAMLWIDPR